MLRKLARRCTEFIVQTTSNNRTTEQQQLIINKLLAMLLLRKKKFGHALRATTLHVKRPNIISQQEPRKPDQIGHDPRKSESLTTNTST